MLSKIIRLVAVLLFSFGCSDVTQDPIRPQIESFKLNAKEFAPGDIVTAKVAVSDNQELKQIRILIFTDFAKNFGGWREVLVEDVGGRYWEASYDFVVPDTALAGLYGLSFQAADERGNGTIDSTLHFTVIQEGFAPQIIYFQTSPELSGDVLLADTSTALTFEGSFADDVDLEEIMISFNDDSGISLRKVSYSVADSLTTYDLSSAEPDTVFFDDFSRYPTEMVLTVEDSDGHQTRRVYEVEVEQ